MSKPKYTVEVHVKRLKGMLRYKDLYLHCPANKWYRMGEEAKHDDKRWADDPYPCDICQTFVDIPKSSPWCPCEYYGPRQARRITLQKIAEWEEK